MNQSSHQKNNRYGHQKWIILHHGSLFAQILAEILCKSASIMSFEELVLEGSILIDIEDCQKSTLTINGKEVTHFQSKLMYHEGFYQLGEVLQCYSIADRAYVQSSWQALLISMFYQMKRVINPVCPESIGMTTFQLPQTLKIASQVGLVVPQYEILPQSDSLTQSTLWYTPEKSQQSSVKIQHPRGELVTVVFAKSAKDCYMYWPDIPLRIRMRLKIMCRMMGLDVGEAYFYVEQHWVFYGIRPYVSEKNQEGVLEEVALCIKKFGEDEEG